MDRVKINCNHIRGWSLFYDEFSKALGFPSFYRGDMNAWSGSKALIKYLDSGASLTNVTISSDGGGCLPAFNEQAALTSSYHAALREDPVPHNLQSIARQVISQSPHPAISLAHAEADFCSGMLPDIVTRSQRRHFAYFHGYGGWRLSNILVFRRNQLMQQPRL